MSPAIIGLIGIIALLVLMYARMWVGFVMLFVGFWGFVAILGWGPGLGVLATVPYRNVANYTFAAVPLFLLMGEVLFNTGIAADLFYSAYKWIGQLRGGLAMACAIASALLGVVTDSLVAAITLGKVAAPEMKKYNYDDSLAAASIVAGASLASLIPPSIGFILYGMLTNVSVGELYIGAIIPGIVLTVLILLLITILVRINPSLAPAGPKTSFKEKIVSLKYTWTMGLLILLIVGGIYAGVFTPTEAGAVGAFGAIVIALLARRLTTQNLLNSILETAKMTSMMVLLVAGAFVFQTMMTVSKLPFMLSDLVTGLALSRYFIIAIIMLVYIILGMFCDIISCIIITVPILFPVIVAMGFDPIWFGVIMAILAEMGLITPPVGMNVFMFYGVTGIPIGTIFRGEWPFVGAMLIFIVILTIFPQIVTFLPDTM
jgi:tripartite ATP-independent transporter DctM subunit